ncbi:mpv17-like protein 2 [Ptychodera flava]|uniref:mpv17-like protein 2 n=1 Tax=Ptychodera flava TaxID=63121 RepID=UPI003969D39B
MLSVLRTTTEKLFSKYLFFTNTVTCGGLLAMGDMIQQSRERSLVRRHVKAEATASSSLPAGRIHGVPDGGQTTVALHQDWSRTGRMFLIGLMIGPFNHVWYKFLDHFLPARTTGVIVRKILLDQIVASPFFATTFFMGMGLLEGETVAKSFDILKEKFISVYTADWCVWPAAQCINFYFVPTRFRVLYVNGVTLGWDTFLSYVKHIK